jgi:hypothetical protein
MDAANTATNASKPKLRDIECSSQSLQPIHAPHSNPFVTEYQAGSFMEALHVGQEVLWVNSLQDSCQLLSLMLKLLKKWYYAPCGTIDLWLSRQRILATMTI